MRLNKLELIRYGRFQDAQLCFPHPASGSPDVVIVYGPNEAGKSTAFNGMLDLLFGIRLREHPYAFLFQRKDLLIGAELEIPSRGTITLRRNSSSSQSLLDEHNQPVDEALAASAVHGLSREVFEERFSLNEPGLREGGKRIADAKGDLGHLLYAGVSGLTSVTSMLSELEATADTFHKKGGRKTELKEKKDRLTDIGRQLRKAALSPRIERQLADDCEEAKEAFEQSEIALKQALNRQAAAKAAQVWYERTETIELSDEQLESYPQGPVLSSDAHAQITAQAELIVEKDRQIQKAVLKQSELEKRIATLTTDDLAQQLSAELARFDAYTIDGAPLEGRATTARADLNTKKAEQSRLKQALDTSKSKLSLDAATPLAHLVEDLDLETLSKAVELAISTSLDAKNARNLADQTQASLGPTPPEPRDLSALETAYDEWSDTTDLSAAEESMQSAKASLHRAEATLGEHWRDCVKAGLPSRDSLQRLADKHTELKAAHNQAESNLTDMTARAREATATRCAYESSVFEVDSVIIEDTRRLREISWQAHLNDLTEKTAEIFEQAMRDDDTARAHFLSGNNERERLFNAREAEAVALASQKTAEETRAGIEIRVNENNELIHVYAKKLGLTTQIDANALTTQHDVLTTAARAEAEYNLACERLAARKALDKERRLQLEKTAADLGMQSTGVDLGDAVAKALATREHVARSWTQWQEMQGKVEDLLESSESKKSQHASALEALTVITVNMPLEDKTPDALHRLMPELRRLQQTQREYDDISQSIDSFEQALAKVSATAQRLVGIGASSAGDDPLATIDLARKRVHASEEADRLRESSIKQRDEALREIKSETVARSEVMNSINSWLDGQTESELPTLQRLSELKKRDEIRASRAESDKQRLAERAGVDTTLFDEELAQLPNSTRMMELEQLVSDAQTARDTALKNQQAAEDLYNNAFKADEREDLISEQAILLEELRSGARQAAVARLAALAARGALKRLATERRSSMIDDVEKSFITITAPKWKGVEVWSESKGEKLVGVTPEGKPVAAENMSTGTQGQLYFALRVAGYKSFARETGPLPLILDDIMETFDNDRALAALHLCAEVGTIGQAIMFTHHEHILDLARQAYPGISIVEMPG